MSSATLAKTPLAPPGESVASTTNAFVINLVSSTTPVALTRPDHAGLKRFTFFVSRRREDGRERFRLHMGYFDTQEQAEQLLDIVRSIYPGAWAGLAPGRRLSSAAHAAAAPEQASAPPAPPPAAAPTMPTAPSTQNLVPSTLALLPDEGRRPLADVDDVVPGPPQPGAAAPVVPAARPEATRVQTPFATEQRAARHSLRNIRAAIASLEDTGIRSPVLDALPELQPAVIPVAQPVPNSTQGSDLTNTATLRLLETGGPAHPAAAVATSAAAITPPTAPAQAGRAVSATREAASREVPREVPREEKPCYAVQLMWSVQPIDMGAVPQLAIFGAYTLYGAEGNRDGRRWYGLRLGFFTDAMSAKQVAQYVRADFATVSVVPVTLREREQAIKAIGGTTGAPVPVKASTAPKPVAADAVRGVHAMAAAAKPRAKAMVKPLEFAFIEGTESRDTKAAPPNQRVKAVPTRMIAGRPTRGAPGKRAKVRKPGQINARASAKPKTLEETLEILGANQLQVDTEANASINDSGVRHLRLESGKGRASKLSRLIGRLSERMGS